MGRFLNQSSLIVIWGAVVALVLVESIRQTMAVGSEGAFGFAVTIIQKWTTEVGTPEAIIVFSSLGATLAGLIRRMRGGNFLDADNFVRDSMSTIVIHALLLIWFDLVFDLGPGISDEQPAGRLVITMAFAQVILARLTSMFRKT